MTSDPLRSCTDAFRTVSLDTVVIFPTSNGIGILPLIRQSLVNPRFNVWRTTASFKTRCLNKVIFLTVTALGQVLNPYFSI